MTSTAFSDALDRLHRKGPEFGGDEHGNNGLTNHAPMVVEVLDRRGYGDGIRRWTDRYADKLRDLPSSVCTITDTTWQQALGAGDRIGDWTDYFRLAVTERDWQDVLIEWWPRLLPGIIAGSTHGLIRTAHSARALGRSPSPTDPELAELAHGLAFWAARSKPIPKAAVPAGQLDVARALDEIPHLADQSGVIVARLARLAELPGWAAAQQSLRPPREAAEVPAVLGQLVHAATVRYLRYGYGSPVLLVHTATAPNAVLNTLPLLPVELWTPSLASVWSASAAIVASYEPAQPQPRSELPSVAGTTDADDLIEQAVAHGDEHVMKFTDTAVEVFEATGDPDALAAATSIRSLIAPPGGWGKRNPRTR